MVQDKDRKLPRFHNVQEMADFFDHTDVSELDLEDADVEFERPRMAHVSVRIPEDDLAAIKALAKKLGVGHTAFIRMILHQAVAEK
ncbi:MAG: CopG family antitoxin [Thermoanaerobacterales bacterium]|nr:CopG family antitoxin [Bacillota bacterium]MDI6908122.1 CopG family antitoxin [Thermoanaerobacterales bacterium]